MFETWSIGRKIATGFGVAMALVVCLSAYLWWGVGDLTSTAKSVVSESQQDQLMVQLETDHLAWANEVARLLTDPHPGDLAVQTDPHKCDLGTWYYGQGRQDLEQMVPSLQPVLARLEAPHRALHEAAAQLGALQGGAGPDSWRAEAQKIYTNRIMPQVEATIAILEEARGDLQAEGPGQQAIVEQASFLRMVAAGLGAVVVLLGLVIGFLISRSMATSMRKIMIGLEAGAEQVASASEQVSLASQDLAEGASHQASSLEETSATLETMAATTRENATASGEANELAEQLGSVALQGQQSMQRMTEAIQKIKDSSDRTASIIKTIDEIAFQTNLLALNAAVEAARAGDAGKGFAVVAEEVRNLAQRSATAARDTGNLIDEARNNAEDGVAVTQEVRSLLEHITDSADKVTGLIAGVHHASQEQSRGIGEINIAVGLMDQVTQNNAANAEETASASEELASQSRELKSLVDDLRMLVTGSRAEGQQSPEVQQDVDEGPVADPAPVAPGVSIEEDNWRSHLSDVDRPSPPTTHAQVVCLDEEEMIEI